MAAKNWDQLVTVSIALACGHRLRPSKPLRAIDAYPFPGRAALCERCDDETYTTRVTLRLAQPMP